MKGQYYVTQAGAKGFALKQIGREDDGRKMGVICYSLNYETLYELALRWNKEIVAKGRR